MIEVRGFHAVHRGGEQLRVFGEHAFHHGDELLVSGDLFVNDERAGELEPEPLGGEGGQLFLGALHPGNGEIVIAVEEQIAQAVVQRRIGDGVPELDDLRVHRGFVRGRKPCVDAVKLTGDIRLAGFRGEEQVLVAEGRAAGLHGGAVGSDRRIQHRAHFRGDARGVALGAGKVGAGNPPGQRLAERGRRETHGPVRRRGGHGFDVALDVNHRRILRLERAGGGGEVLVVGARDVDDIGIG